MTYKPVLKKSMCRGKTMNKPKVRQTGVGAAIIDGTTIQQELVITRNNP